MKNKENIKKITVGAALTALVILLQLAGSFIRFGPFSISLVLVPIVIGATLYGPWIGSWLGAVFGFTVLLSGDAALFLEVDPFGTIVTVLLKGVLCGLLAGLIYNVLNKATKKKYISSIVAAIVCPIVNTGIFLLGCLVFFMPTIESWALAGGYGESVFKYMIVGLVGLNFVIELAVNIIICPIILRVLALMKIDN